MKAYFSVVGVSIISMLIYPLSASATSLGQCSKEPNASFDQSDAVVLARVVSVTESSPQPPKHDMVTIKVEKFWKKKGELPEVVHVRPGAISNKNATYLLFLKDYGSGYQPEICSPSVIIGQSDKQRGIESIFDLAPLEVHNVD